MARTKKMLEKAKLTIEQTSQKIGRKGGTADAFISATATTIEKVSKHINDAALTARDRLDDISEETQQFKKENLIE